MTHYELGTGRRQKAEDRSFVCEGHEFIRRGGFCERARLQSCRKRGAISRASAPEARVRGRKSRRLKPGFVAGVDGTDESVPFRKNSGGGATT